MKAAIIAPVALLEKYVVTDYHLTLVDLLVESSEYLDFYQHRGLKGDFIIIDNSAHEFGTSRHEDYMTTFARTLHASEVVLPERMFWGRDTIEMAAEVYDYYREELPEISIMGVPQGRTIDEWDWCCREHLNMGVDTIGISKDFEVWPGGLVGRVTAVRYLCRQTQRGHVDVHMLGWGRNLWELNSISEIASHPIAPIRGVDSAKPLVYAASGITLPTDFYHAEVPEYPRRPSTFFELNDIEIDEQIARENIASYLCQVSEPLVGTKPFFENGVIVD